MISCPAWRAQHLPQRGDTAAQGAARPAKYPPQIRRRSAADPLRYAEIRRRSAADPPRSAADPPQIRRDPPRSARDRPEINAGRATRPRLASSHLRPPTGAGPPPRRLAQVGVRHAREGAGREARRRGDGRGDRFGAAPAAGGRCGGRRCGRVERVGSSCLAERQARRRGEPPSRRKLPRNTFRSIS